MGGSSDRFQVLPYWRTIVALLTPLVLLPLPLLSATPEARCGYVICLMAIYWMTEALPLAITALIPIVGFPLLGVMSTAELCLVYMTETNMMFLGGLTVAIAVEHCGLHKRIALFVLINIGQSPRRLMFGFMFTTMFLSMWISNTASTAMMVPIVDAIMIELYRKKIDNVDDKEPSCHGTESDSAYLQKIDDVDDKKSSLHDTGSTIAICKTGSDNDATEDASATDETDQLTDVGRTMRKALMLSVAYSANIGGTGVVTGTSPNLILMGTLASSYSEPTGLTFASYMGYNVPGMLLAVLLAWVWLQVLFLGCRRKEALQETTDEQKGSARLILVKKYRELGSITFHETVVLTLFIFLVFMWTFRSPEFIPGWAHYFVRAFGDAIEVDDATPVMLIVFLLFMIPKNLNFWWFRDPNNTDKVESIEACLNWKVLHEKVPWGVVLLLGGGFAMAEAAETSGLSYWLGLQLQALDVMPVEAIVFVVSFMTAMATEVASNTATASILMPVLNELSIGIGVNPLYLMLPATVCCSYAFMLPVATPPNAIVFAAARMKTTEMMKAGLMMNIVCVLVTTLMINTLGIAMFDLKQFPSWANSTSTRALL